jgi:ubiquinone/menaquinone biosynthesis C-methylase UbiE
MKLTKTKTQSFYDRVADVHNLVFKINGYRDSVSKYLRSLNLDISDKSLVLDAGCGTGLVTLALNKAGYSPKKTIALDLSFKSLGVANEQFQDDKKTDASKISAIQGNILSLPFADESFDIVLTCGALEYVSLGDGLRELSRVLKPSGTLVLLPIRPSLVGSVLEFLYNFKSHSINEVKRSSQAHFHLVGDYNFPLTEPIGWSKKLFLLVKK